MRKFLLILLTLTTVIQLSAATWYVAPSAVGSGNGSSCSNAAAATSLQTIINTAAAGDVIKLLGGIFTINASIDINKALTLEGAGMGTTVITCLSSTTSLSPFSITSANVTIKNLTLDAFPGATNNAKGFFVKGKTGILIQNVEFKNMPAGQNAEIIYIDNNLGTTEATIDGCWFHDNTNSNCIKISETASSKPMTITIQNCVMASTSNSRSFPAGIYYDQTDGSTSSPVSVTIDNCWFSCLTTNARGAGIGLYGGVGSLDPQFNITDCTFVGNQNTSTSEGGGAVYLARRITCSIERCLFDNNTSTGDGGGALYADGISTQDVILNIANSIFTNNNGKDGGAVHFRKPSPSGGTATTLTNCLFHHNTSSGGGGAIGTESTSFNVTVNNSTFTVNDGGSTNKEAINAVNGGTFLISSSIIWGNPSNGTTNDELLASSTTGTINNSVYVTANATSFSGTGNSGSDPLLNGQYEPTSGTPAGYRIQSSNGGFPGDNAITDGGGCASRSFNYPIPQPFCINPATESGSASSSGGIAITNVASNDFVNGVAATLGSGGNATVSTSGTWPLGITLNPTTGEVAVANGTSQGSYDLTYELCDVVTSPPSCAMTTIQVMVAAPAPITLMHFDATPAINLVNLSWVTASEYNNDFFEVYRSNEGSRWVSIGKVASLNGNSQSTQFYYFTDKTPQNGTNYYQLRQVDTNGDATFSPIRSVQLGKEAKLITAPNPVTDGVLQLSAENEIQSVSIVTPSGQKVYEILNADPVLEQTILLMGMPPGIYVVQATLYNGTIVSKKVVIKDSL